ncbi:hypothetical protein [Actinomadura hibisca]|uniref:hypothetical protein n=1 Tax=Actinomadura hibisca TaxID=68565 RepID=UPI00082A3EF0|nr:hypothetical protein [Actinomadura hibisca]
MPGQRAARHTARHAVRFEGRRPASSPPDVEPASKVATATVVPQRERVSYLTHLAQRFGPVVGYTTGFGVIDQEPVLNVIPVDRHGRALRAVTVRCAYRRECGAWWFVYHRTGRPIAPANELNAAANKVRTDMEREVGT